MWPFPSVVGSAEKPVLLPCGNLRRETIPTALAEAGESVCFSSD